MEREPIFFDYQTPYSHKVEKFAMSFAQYENGRTAIIIQEVEAMGPSAPIHAVLTVNLPRKWLQPDEFFVKAWSENESIANWVRALEIFEDTGKRQKTGFVEAEIWRFKDEKE